MKELEKFVQVDKNEIRQERQIYPTKVKVRRIILKKGLTLWQFSLKTGQVSPVNFEENTVTLKNEVRRSFTGDPGYLYVQALNLTNAMRKFKKIVTPTQRFQVAPPVPAPDNTEYQEVDMDEFLKNNP